MAPRGRTLPGIPFRAPRRVHHMDCDSFNCVAYTADDQALYTIPREQYFGINADDPQEAWLSCQSGNDLLTTFERYDKCRGVTIGLPLADSRPHRRSAEAQALTTRHASRQLRAQPRDFLFQRRARVRSSLSATPTARVSSSRSSRSRQAVRASVTTRALK